jgi:hypothetical protein
MRRARNIFRLFAIAAVLFGSTTTAPTAGSEDPANIKIIVHPNNPSDAVGRGFLRDAYLKKATEWHGNTIRPVDLSSRFRARGQFIEHVIRKTPAQLRTYWNQQVFSGKGVPPPELRTTADVIAYVTANPGAVGYLPADADPGKAKVIGIR